MSQHPATLYHCETLRLPFLNTLEDDPSLACVHPHGALICHGKIGDLTCSPMAALSQGRARRRSASHFRTNIARLWSQHRATPATHSVHCLFGSQSRFQVYAYFSALWYSKADTLQCRTRMCQLLCRIALPPTHRDGSAGEFSVRPHLDIPQRRCRSALTLSQCAGRPLFFFFVLSCTLGRPLRVEVMLPELDSNCGCAHTYAQSRQF